MFKDLATKFKNKNVCITFEWFSSIRYRLLATSEMENSEEEQHQQQQTQPVSDRQIVDDMLLALDLDVTSYRLGLTQVSRRHIYFLFSRIFYIVVTSWKDWRNFIYFILNVFLVGLRLVLLDEWCESLQNIARSGFVKQVPVNCFCRLYPCFMF